MATGISPDDISIDYEDAVFFDDYCIIETAFEQDAHCYIGVSSKTADEFECSVKI